MCCLSNISYLHLFRNNGLTLGSGHHINAKKPCAECEVLHRRSTVRFAMASWLSKQLDSCLSFQLPELSKVAIGFQPSNANTLNFTQIA